MKKKLTKCCKAPIKIESNGSETLVSHICTKCGKEVDR